MAGAQLRLSDVLLECPDLSLPAGVSPDLAFVGLCTWAETLNGPPEAAAGWLIMASPADGELPVLRRSATGQHAAAILWWGPSAGQPPLGAGTPVVLAPPGLRSVDVRATVDELLRRLPNIQEWRRLSAHAALTEALLSPEPESELLARFATLTGEAAVVLGVDHEVVASTGELPVRSVARHLARLERPTAQFRLGRWSVTATRLSAPLHGNEDGAWLARARRHDALPDPQLPAAVALRELLVVYAETRRNLSRRQVMRASELLNRLVSPIATKDGLEEALLNRGFPRHAHLALLHAGGREEVFRQEHIDAVVAAAARSLVPALAGFVNGRLAVLTVTSDEGDDIAQRRSVIKELVEALPAPVGVSLPFTDIAHATRAWRECAVAAVIHEDERAAGVAKPRPAVFFSQCNSVAHVAAALGFTQLGKTVESVQAAVESVPGAADVVAAMVANDYSIPRAAKTLSCHPNTVRNRLESLAEHGQFSHGDFELWDLWNKLRQSPHVHIPLPV